MIEKKILKKLIDDNNSTRKIAILLKCSQNTVMHYCNKYNLRRKIDYVPTKNIKYTEPLYCLYCKKETKRRTNKKFCSSKCIADYKTKQNIKKWLETGKAKTSTNNDHYIKKYLYKKQNNKCAICKMDRIWNNKELVFILDHIDGDSKKNNRENLRLICPNCDSQLPTFAGRNKGNGRHKRRQRYRDGKSY